MVYKMCCLCFFKIKQIIKRDVSMKHCRTFLVTTKEKKGDAKSGISQHQSGQDYNNFGTVLNPLNPLGGAGKQDYNNSGTVLNPLGGAGKQDYNSFGTVLNPLGGAGKQDYNSFGTVLNPLGGNR
jgi:hypothetical protein